MYVYLMAAADGWHKIGISVPHEAITDGPHVQWTHVDGLLHDVP